MSETNQSVADQLNLGGAGNDNNRNGNDENRSNASNGSNPFDGNSSNTQDTDARGFSFEDTTSTDDETGVKACTQSDTMKRRGFFEAIKHHGNPQWDLAALLKEHELQTKAKLEQADQLAEQRLAHLQQRIAAVLERLSELEQLLEHANQYNEAEDDTLQMLLQQQAAEEKKLLDIRQKITDIRQKLGAAKAGIINQSLSETEQQVNTALNIQKNIYEQTKALNQQKFEDEKAHLQQLAQCYEPLYKAYETRYQKVDKHLTVLDVDGISPVTTRVLTTIGTASFGAAGFFFSTFAGQAGFSNQDILYFMMEGLFETVGKPMAGWLKLLVLVGLIALVTTISVVCNYLLSRLKRNSDEEILSEVMLGASSAQKLKQFEYNASVKSNNWYGFWLQLIPGILIAGLIMIGIAQPNMKASIGAINASAEGLVVGTCLAMALAGLIYMYIIKIVEPRLVKRYDANADAKVNWIRANWELVAILTVFLLFVAVVIAVPFESGSTTFGILPADQRTRYAILLFLAICLVGGICFAYSVRSRGLIETSRYLERVMRRLKSVIAYCNAPQAPELHNEVAEEHGNIIRQVLRQFSFHATVNKEESYHRSKHQWTTPKDWFSRLFGGNNDEENPQGDDPVRVIIAIQPWEERYFPDIVEELRAAYFEYTQQQQLLRKSEALVAQHRAEQKNNLQNLKDEKSQCLSNKTRFENEQEQVTIKKGARVQWIHNTYNKAIVDLLDGFHLGLWYRANGLGPTPDFYAPDAPIEPSIALISTNQQ